MTVHHGLIPAIRERIDREHRPNGMSIDRFLADHDGVVSRAQARACGLTDAQIARRVASGAWLRRAPSVFFAVAWVWGAAARVRVAAEWARPNGTLTGCAAAWWSGLGVDSPHPITVAFPPGRPRRPPGTTIVTQRDLRGDRELVRGLWVTGRALAVLDTAVDLGEVGRAFLDRALQQHVTLHELVAAQSRHLGRRGSAVAGRLLASAADRTASEPERLVVRLLRASGLTGWVVNAAVTLSDGSDAIIDIAFGSLRLAIEVDGWAFHVDHDRFVHDRARKRALVADGWTVIEVTWHDLVHRPDEVVAQIRRVVLRLSADRQAS